MAHDVRRKMENKMRGNAKNMKKAHELRGAVKKKPVSLKNQIRGIQRLLKKEGLDARIRKKEEAKLEELIAATEDHKRVERERIYAVRYHKVRFFERVKLERRIKKVEKQIAEAKELGNEAVAALVERLACLQDDLQYVVHFPKGEKYVSILRDAEEPAAQAALAAERERLRALVHKQQAEIAMVTEADEGAALLARQRRHPQQATANHHVAADAPLEAAEELHGEEKDDFFTPDHSDRSASEAEHFHSLPPSAKSRGAASREKPGAERPPKGELEARAAAAERTEMSSLRDAGSAGAEPGPKQQRQLAQETAQSGVARTAAVAVPTAQEEGDIADDDDFFLQSGASGSDSSDGDAEDEEGRGGAGIGPAGSAEAARGRDDRIVAGQRASVGVGERMAQAQRRDQPQAQHWNKVKGGAGRPGAQGKPQTPGGGKWAGAGPRLAAGGQTPQFKAQPKGKAAAGGGKRRADAAVAADKPKRTRAEGGRKRRKK